MISACPAGRGPTGRQRHAGGKTFSYLALELIDVLLEELGKTGQDSPAEIGSHCPKLS